MGIAKLADFKSKYKIWFETHTQVVNDNCVPSRRYAKEFFGEPA